VESVARFVTDQLAAWEVPGCAVAAFRDGRSRAELVRALRYLPLSKDLRQEFQYCNLGYLVAGHVVETLFGVPWEDFVRGRLLEPLGMRRTNLSVEEMLADGDHAAAYTRRDGVIPQRPLPAVAPAGAINSSAADMARWLLVQLAAQWPGRDGRFRVPGPAGRAAARRGTSRSGAARCRGRGAPRRRRASSRPRCRRCTSSARRARG
jgi:CubicO group peptidase (beta-lactamase class C family)